MPSFFSTIILMQGIDDGRSKRCGCGSWGIELLPSQSKKKMTVMEEFVFMTMFDRELYIYCSQILVGEIDVLYEFNRLIKVGQLLSFDQLLLRSY